MSDSPQTPREDDWLLPPGSEPPPDRPGTTAPGRFSALGARFGRGWKAAALVVAGLIVGGGTVAVAQAVGGSDQAAAVADHNGLGGGTGSTDGSSGPGGPGAPGGPGQGRAGEQHLQGTVTGTTSSSISVRTDSGTKTYAVTHQTQIVRNGTTSSLSDLKTGDPIFLHVYPGSGSRMVAERIFAGSAPSGGGDGFGPGTPGRPFGDDGGHDGDSTT